MLQQGKNWQTWICVHRCRKFKNHWKVTSAAVRMWLLYSDFNVTRVNCHRASPNVLFSVNKHSARSIIVLCVQCAHVTLLIWTQWLVIHEQGLWYRRFVSLNAAVCYVSNYLSQLAMYLGTHSKWIGLNERTLFMF
jgi:hypothetical protein